MTDTSTKEGQGKKLMQLVRRYTERHNWATITRLIGGKPRYDLGDYSDADAGEPPKGAEWV